MLGEMMSCKEAVALLRRGELIAFPTETVYGLGAPLFSPRSIKKIFQVKGRPQDNPLIVHVASKEQLKRVVTTYPEELVEKFWPGPLTLVLPKNSCVSELVTAGLPTVAVRMPAHPLALELIELLGEPLVAPSANLSGSPSSTLAEHVRSDFGDQLGGILDGGACMQGLESTVLALDPPKILRPGSITRNELERVLETNITTAQAGGERPPSPGMKYRHYAPKAKVRLVETHALVEKQPGRLILDSLLPSELYTTFRDADLKGYEEIVIRMTPGIKEHEALLNRLLKAAATSY